MDTLELRKEIQKIEWYIQEYNEGNVEAFAVLEKSIENILNRVEKGNSYLVHLSLLILFYKSRILFYSLYLENHLNYLEDYLEEVRLLFKGKKFSEQSSSLKENLKETHKLLKIAAKELKEGGE